MTPFESWCAERGTSVEDWFLTTNQANLLLIPSGLECGLAEDDGSDEPYFYVKGQGHRFLRLDMIEVKRDK
jgi:hypothetical protein